MEIKKATTDSDIASCWDAMSLLRPNLIKRKFVNQIKQMQRHGYVLIYLTEPNTKKVVSVAGYRFLNMLYCGNIIYIDDLVTLPECRGKGYGNILLNFVLEVAKKNQCKAVHLDSGPTRYDAHKLYFKQGFTIGAFHFNKLLP